MATSSGDMSAPAAAALAASAASAGASSLSLNMGWLIFVTGMIAAATLDVMVVSRPSQLAREGAVAGGGFRCCSGPPWPVFARQIAFWLVSGMLFMLFVWQLLGSAEAGSWLYGYFLEYTLSIDNLFVFQLIFKAYSTPEQQVERALFWGILAAVFLRLVFFGVGTGILALGFIARLVFGLILVYSGFKTFTESGDDEDDDPSQNMLVRCVSRLLPLHDIYGQEPDFFVWVPQGSGTTAIPDSASLENAEMNPTVLGSPSSREIELAAMLDAEDPVPADFDALAGSSPLPRSSDGASQTAGRRAEDSESPVASGATGVVLKVTPLFLVVVSLGLIDVIFAVDSVTAKISSVAGFAPEVSFFLNLTSSAFAMFVLRSLYVVVDLMVHMFRFLKYGVGSVLVLIGLKLILTGYVEVGMLASGSLILAMLAVSVLASVIVPPPKEDEAVVQP